MSKQKVVMLVYNYFQNDSRVLKEAYTLSDNNYEVSIFAIWKEGLQKIEILYPNVTVYRLDFVPLHKKIIGVKNFKRLKALIYGKPKLVNNSSLEKSTKPISGFEKHKLSSIKFITNLINKYFSYKGFYIDAKKKIKSLSLTPNIIHAHDLNMLPLGKKIKRTYKSKLIYDSHELYVYRNKPYITPNWFKKLETGVERRNIKHADKVITVSQSIVEHLQKTYKIDTPELIMNAPSKKSKQELSPKNNFRTLLNVSDDKKILIYSGAISFNRGLDKIIEALKNIPNAYLIYLGRGNENFKMYLAETAKLNQVDNRFTMYGPVKPYEVTSFVQSADIGVAPIENVCLSYYYCAPNKVFEYIQGGIPVVASNFPDLKMVVEDNKIGTTFNPDSPLDIAEKINTILNDDELLRLFKSNTHNLKDKYKWENEQTKLLALYKELN